MAYLTLILPMCPSQRSRSRKKEAAIFLPKLLAAIKGAKLMRGTKYHISLTFHGKWLNRDGSIKRRDVHNYVHALCDLLEAPLGIDDSQFWKFSSTKIHTTGREWIQLRIDPC